MLIQTLKGFRDFLPKEAKKRQYVIRRLTEVFESYGFEPLETPALEYEEILLGKYGEEGDKLMYRFTDNGGRKVALRYDQTVPLARVIAEYQNELPMPFKRYQVQNVWRAENTQKGRYRGFLQCDADIVGTASPFSDAEVIALAARSLEKLGFDTYKILINDRCCFSKPYFKTSFDISIERIPGVFRSLDKLKKIEKEGVSKELQAQGFSATETEEILNNVPKIEPTERLKKIEDFLKKLGLSENKFQFKRSLARGLDYYTSTIFEIEIEGYSAGSVCGGGRYDNLIGIFGGKPIPAVGFAFGFDRLIEAMDQLNLFPKELLVTKVLVTVFSKDYLEKAIEISSRLRGNNINCEVYLNPDTPLDKQLKYADQKVIPYVVITGPDEISKKVVTLRNMKTREQKQIDIEELLNELRKE